MFVEYTLPEVQYGIVVSVDSKTRELDSNASSRAYSCETLKKSLNLPGPLDSSKEKKSRNNKT